MTRENKKSACINYGESSQVLTSKFGGGGEGGRPDIAATAPAQMLPDEDGVELCELLGLLARADISVHQ